MASLITGYEYDIFISYRQKDNKGDRWVSEFVEALKTELESTFKEDISVYFDINPHDGLLETHDVDASLKDKLKCLVFIPIISRTYCDPKSFAWEHEFKAFVEQASQDQFGLKVKLPNGNVANRILPVRIYDLDSPDIKLCESVLGGVLRSVDFIYKSAGVNRPLRANEDHPQDNLNKTYYRDQINKVANSIKEVITAIGNNIPQQKQEVSKEILAPEPVLRKNRRTKIITASVIAMVLIVLGYLIVPKLIKPTELERSIAVLPFINDSPGTNEENSSFVNGLMEEILINLQSIKDFRVPGRTSVEQYRNNKTRSIPEIARELGVNYIVEGSCQKYGNTLRLRVQLIRAKGKEAHLWAKSYEQEIQATKDIFNVQSQVAEAIAAELKTAIRPEEKQLINKIPTTNMVALNMYLQGSELAHIARRDNKKDFISQAEVYFKKAIQLDSTYSDAYRQLGWLFVMRRNWDSTLYYANRALHFDDKNVKAYSVKAIACYHLGLDKETEDAARLALKYNPNDGDGYHTMASVFWKKGEYGSAVEFVLKAIQLEKEPYERSDYFRSLCHYLISVGFWEEGLKYAKELIKFDNDSLYYYSGLLSAYIIRKDFPSALKIALKLYGWDPEMTRTNLINHFIYAKDYKGALKQVEEYIKMREKQGNKLNPYFTFGYVYLKNGLKEKSVYHIEGAVRNQLKKIEQDQPNQSVWDYYDLACMYSAIDDKGKAIESLSNALKCNNIAKMSPWIIRWSKNYPILDTIRDEPEFKEFLKSVENLWLPERTKIEKVLKEEGIFK